MAKNVIICGVSGAGKSTASNYLTEQHGFKEYHPLRFYKSWLESYYGLNEMDLEDQELRKQTMFMRPKVLDFAEIINTCLSSQSATSDFLDNMEYLFPSNCSFIDHMIKFYHFQSLDGRDYKVTENPMNEYVKNNQEDTSFIAIRNQHEVDILMKTGFHIISLKGRGEVKSTDVGNDSFESQLAKKAKTTTRISNTSTIKSLYVQLDDWVEHLG